MGPERLRQIETLFHVAAELEGLRRSDFLREACGADESLRREIESLLAYQSEAKAGEFIETPAMDLEARALAKEENPTEPSKGGCTAPWRPTNIGRYRVIRLLGEGGMGAVYEAEQEQPRRTVALKVIKPGLAEPELLQRFQQEAQALARLQHSGIAQIYEAGTADTGFGPQPYFAMELIRGESLRDYARKNGNTRQRLELMARVADAVHHAHQRGLIHRDLKPGNILVDEAGQPKILDFGVARVTDSDAQATRLTDLGQLVGTIAYMSPEQVLGDPLELDTRSDVYALGVILYELLAGRLPYQISRKLHEAVQTIREEEPARLSSINRTYRGDIEVIVAKAIEKDKAHRYASAADLAADIRRYLNHEPVAAQRPGTIYHVRKFARRHKAVVAAVAAVFIVLIAGVAASTWEALRANREAATAKAVNDFLQDDLLAQAGAYSQVQGHTKPDPDLKVRTALDRAALLVRERFVRQPAVEASIRQTLGSTYFELGLYPEAEKQWSQAAELRRRILGGDHRDTLHSMTALADAYSNEGKQAQAEALLRQTLTVLRRRFGEDHADTQAALGGLARVYIEQARQAEAEKLLAKVFDTQSRLLGPANRDTLFTLQNLAVAYSNEGKYPEASAAFSKALETERRVLGEEHPATLATMGMLGVSYTYEAKYEQAEPLLSHALEIQRRVLGEEHPASLDTMGWLADAYRKHGKYAEAETLFTRVLAAQRRVLGEEHFSTLANMEYLGLLYTGQAKYEPAEQLLSKTFEIRRRVLGAEHAATLNSMNSLSELYYARGDYERAEALQAQCLEIQRRVLGKEYPSTLQTMGNLATTYLKESKFTQAERLLNETWEIKRRVLGEDNPGTLTSLNNLGVLYRDQANYSKAEPILARVLEMRLRVLGDQHPETLSSRYSLALLYQRERKYGQAEPLFIKAWEGWRRVLGEQHPYTSLSVRQLVQLYGDWGRPEQAAAWRAKLPRVTN